MSTTSCVLLSRPGCHLCDEMRQTLEAVLPPLGESFDEKSVDSRRDWRERYGDVIPVLLRDGRAVAKIRLDPQQLLRIVRRSRSQG